MPSFGFSRQLGATGLTGLSAGVYLGFVIILLAVTFSRIGRVVDYVRRAKDRYRIGQLPEPGRITTATRVFVVLSLWVASIALLLAAAALDQWSTWSGTATNSDGSDVALDAQWGILSARFSVPGTQISNLAIPYSDLLSVISNLGLAQSVPGSDTLTIIRLVQAAGILTLIWSIVALAVSIVGLLVYAQHYKRQSQALSTYVVQWWWSRKTYNWLVMSRVFNALAFLSWGFIAGIPLLAGAYDAGLSFNFGISWYLAAVSSILIRVATLIAYLQIRFDHNVRSVMPYQPQGFSYAQPTPNARYIDVPPKVISPPADTYRRFDNSSNANCQPRSPTNAPQYPNYPPPAPPSTAAAEREARIAAGWWPRWTYWR